MSTSIYTANSSDESIVPEKESNLPSKQSSVVDPQVKLSKSRRTFDTAYKARILASYDACSSADERSSFLRREGLYYSVICNWKREKVNPSTKKRNHREARRSDHIARENTQLKKRLAQAEAIIELQKKVSDLFGQHILSPSVNE